MVEILVLNSDADRGQVDSFDLGDDVALITKRVYSSFLSRGAPDPRWLSDTNYEKGPLPYSSASSFPWPSSSVSVLIMPESLVVLETASKTCLTSSP